MGYVDVNRAQALVAQSGLDGLFVVSPENFEYFAGVSGFPVTMWRRAGPASALLAADGRVAFVIPETIQEAVQRANPTAQIFSYQLWIETIDVTDITPGGIDARVAQATVGRKNERPETYDPKELDAQLQRALKALGLSGKKVGIELEFAPADHVTHFQSLFPTTQLVNSSPLTRELRLIKTPAEIDLLRRGVQLTEHGITAALVGLHEQTIAAEIRFRYNEAIFAEAARRGEFSLRGGSTTVHLGPALWARSVPSRPAQRGDLVQFDSTVNLSGYRTDMGRTFTFGPATDSQKRIQAALLAGFQAGLDYLKPGIRFCDLFVVAQNAVRAAGFPSYARGHLGHSIGSDIDGEEWPWISATEERVIEPGMVLAFEVPYYVNGIGGFQNEDDLLITEQGYESLNTLPLSLVEIGG
ncbi:MAG: aminopeptidase P family protein [Caldilineaceae bacterium]|nr:aminopeptidase P family protein [Caldilineaceae bacterium]